MGVPMPKLTLFTVAGILLALWLVGWMLKIAGQVIHGLGLLALVFFVVSFFLRGRETRS